MEKTSTNDALWEARCHRCGRCCYEKIDWEGEIHYTDVPCEFLDLRTRLCRVYRERVERRPGCLRLTPDLVFRGLLPGDCPYVAGLENYRAPHLWEGTG